MRNICLTLAYDGTGYVGWQIQSHGISVQGTVEKAIREFTGRAVSLLAAGRTDAGVHALGQVANFRTEVGIPCHGFRAGLQTYLPKDILVVEAKDVALDFHATHAARRKRYRYVILDARARLPFLRNYVHQSYERLDEQAMHAAAQTLVGKHDFRAFESRHPNTAHSVRTVFEVTVGRHHGWPAWDPCAPIGDSDPLFERHRDLSGDFIWIDIVADGFLYNMVRAIAGTLLRVGGRKWNTEDVCRILENGDRNKAGITAPACGLYLVKVEYDATVRRLMTNDSSNAATETDIAVETGQVPETLPATGENAPA